MEKFKRKKQRKVQKKKILKNSKKKSLKKKPQSIRANQGNKDHQPLLKLNNSLLK